jgi:hypothetical protein
MTLEQALTLMGKMKVDGGQSHEDNTDEHVFTSVSVHPENRPDVTIELSVRTRKSAA